MRSIRVKSTRVLVLYMQFADSSIVSDARMAELCPVAHVGIGKGIRSMEWANKFTLN